MERCYCESKAYDVTYCARRWCDNIVCEMHGGMFDGDADEEGYPVNASLCAACCQEDESD